MMIIVFSRYILKRAPSVWLIQPYDMELWSRDLLITQTYRLFLTDCILYPFHLCRSFAHIQFSYNSSPRRTEAIVSILNVRLCGLNITQVEKEQNDNLIPGCSNKYGQILGWYVDKIIQIKKPAKIYHITWNVFRQVLVWKKIPVQFRGNILHGNVRIKSCTPYRLEII